MKLMRNSLKLSFYPWMRTAVVTTAIVLVGLLTTGCDRLPIESAWASTCLSVGLCDEPPKPAILVDVLCDASIGSSCNRQTAEQTLEAILRRIADRPGSSVRLWFLAKSVAETAMVGERTVPAISRGSERGRHAQAERFVLGTREFFLTAANAFLDSPPIRKSPLLEVVSKIALADGGGLERRLVVITDAREMSSLGDFECGILPSDRRFGGLLASRGVLTPGSLSETTVEFAFVRSDPVPARGCPVRVARELRIRALWTMALRRAGAARVDFRSGPPTFVDTAESSKPNKEK